jgi:hypothetical protein
MADTDKQKSNKSKASCCFPLCTKTGYSTECGQKVSFHRFPFKDGTKKKEWLAKIKRDEGPKFRVSKHTRICSRHFTKNDFLISNTGKKSFTQTACPRIFVWSTEKKFRAPPTPPFATCTSETIPHPVVNTFVEVENRSSEVETLLVRIERLEKELSIQRDAAAFFQKERDLLRELLQKQKKSEAKVDFNIERFKYSNEDICFYTGFPTYNALLQSVKQQKYFNLTKDTWL